MLKKLLTIAIALTVPFLLVVANIRLVANPWFIQFEYNRPGFPADQYGFTLEQRTPLALAGLYSVVPEGAGMIELERATLSNGEPAFTAREIKHMRDVRVLMATVFPLALIIGSVLIVLAIVFRKISAYRNVVPQGLRAGATLTLILLAGLIAYVLINFEAFFLQFHQLFFEGDSFAFRYDDTLIRLYPEQLWSDAAILIGVLTGVMAAMLLAGSWWWLKRAKRNASHREAAH
ncbi:MAG: TIGR01906 family membrane protein [Chloroflexi bacterium]|nr:TIGR01906 family membrane protein [Chloroflexota bacterium]